MLILLIKCDLKLAKVVSKQVDSHEVCRKNKYSIQPLKKKNGCRIQVPLQAYAWYSYYCNQGGNKIKKITTIHKINIIWIYSMQETHIAEIIIILLHNKNENFQIVPQKRCRLQIWWFKAFRYKFLCKVFLNQKHQLNNEKSAISQYHLHCR